MAEIRRRRCFCRIRHLTSVGLGGSSRHCGTQDCQCPVVDGSPGRGVSPGGPGREMRRPGATGNHEQAHWPPVPPGRPAAAAARLKFRF